jgi:hypothetical protein
VSSKFASGKYSIAMCDRCGQKRMLSELKSEVVKTKPYKVLVCRECWDPDHPQLLLGMFPVEDSQAVRNPRPDTTYWTSGLGADGYPTGGSRDIQWGWRPVGGARFYDSSLTPNDLVLRLEVGTVSVVVT